MDWHVKGLGGGVLLAGVDVGVDVGGMTVYAAISERVACFISQSSGDSKKSAV